MTQRQRFERWASRNGFDLTRENDGYFYNPAHWSWKAWKLASR